MLQSSGCERAKYVLIQYTRKCIQVATLALRALNFLFLGVSACADHSQLLKNRSGAARRTLTVFLGVELLTGGPPLYPVLSCTGPFRVVSYNLPS